MIGTAFAAASLPHSVRAARPIKSIDIKNKSKGVPNKLKKEKKKKKNNCFR